MPAVTGIVKFHSQSFPRSHEMKIEQIVLHAPSDRLLQSRFQMWWPTPKDGKLFLNGSERGLACEGLTKTESDDERSR